MEKTTILENWNKWALEDKLPVRPVRELSEDDITNIKAGYSRSVWMIHVPLLKRSFPVILKIYHGNKTFRKHYEWKVYQQLEKTLVGEFLPEFYEIKIEREKEEVWIYLKCLEVFEDKKIICEVDLYNITLRLAQFHAATFEHQPISQLIRRTLPEFQTEKLDKSFNILKADLLQAKKDQTLRPIIDQNFADIYKLIEQPLNFTELSHAGRCLVHEDLHLGNICYDQEDQKIKFIDLGVATFSPCWQDVAKFVETALDTYFIKNQEQIRDQCIQIYVKEMERQGVIFPEYSVRLYRLAYLMRVFDKELKRQLRAALEGKKPFKSERILEKVGKFSKDLHLI